MKKFECIYVDTTIGRPYISDYLQHIYDMTCWAVRKDETFKQHLENLIKYFNNRDEKNKAEAVKNFIEFQDKENLGLIMFDVLNIKEDDETCYCNYDFIPKGLYD